MRFPCAMAAHQGLPVCIAMETCLIDNGPAKVSRWNDYYGPAGMILTDFVDDYVRIMCGTFVCMRGGLA